MNITYSVYVGGYEINSGYLNLSDAERIAGSWRVFGLNDVIIVRRVAL